LASRNHWFLFFVGILAQILTDHAQQASDFLEGLAGIVYGLMDIRISAVELASGLFGLLDDNAPDSLGQGLFALETIGHELSLL
jgi:hypothetical protein